jgi:hypothetical protein
VNQELQVAIDKVKQETGFQEDQPDRAILEKDGWRYGERIRVIEDTDEGVNAGDEGFLTICEVGAPEFGNVRACFSIVGVESMVPEPFEVDPDNIEAA